MKGTGDEPFEQNDWRDSLLSELLESVQVRSGIFFRLALAAPWGFTLDTDAYHSSLAHYYGIEPAVADKGLKFGVRRTPFHIVTAGAAWLDVEAVPGRVHLEPGDFIVFPQGHSHSLRDQPETPSKSLAEIFRTHVPGGLPSPTSEVKVGNAGMVTRVICGGVRFENVRTNPLLANLPPLIHVKAAQSGDANALRLTVQQIIEELESARPGHEAVLTRLADILFIKAVLNYFEESLTYAKSGWFGALRDAQIGRAILLLHSQPERPWTVEALAGSVSLSRSAFASKFAELVGEPPLRYLTRVRLDKAARRLSQTKDKLVLISSSSGYASREAFTRAFRRQMGMSPEQYRRSQQQPKPRSGLLSNLLG